MKKLFQSDKYLNYLARRAKKSLKRRLKNRVITKKFCYSLEKRNELARKWLRKSRKYDVTVSAPTNFSFLSNTEKTVTFIDALENHLKKKNKVFVDLELISDIDYGAVTVLLSVMFMFKAAKIKFNGNFPRDITIRKKLIDSQFFEKLERPIGDRVEYTIKKENQIFTKANRKVEPELGLKVMEEAAETIWGEKRVSKGLQRVFLELMQNTHNHASANIPGEEHWWLSVNHDLSGKKVSFVFVDYGQGIFESLENKPNGNKWANLWTKLKNQLKFTPDHPQIFKMLLEGDLHLTATGQHFRGKGLPGIKQVLDRNQISALHVVSNDVYSDVVNAKYFPLKRKFNGTFIYWELTFANVNEKWML